MIFILMAVATCWIDRVSMATTKTNHSLRFPALENVFFFKKSSFAWKSFHLHACPTKPPVHCDKSQQQDAHPLGCTPSINLFTKGSPAPPQRMNFWKSSKRPFTPPSHFRNIMLQIFPNFMTEVSSIMAKICNVNFWNFGTFPKIHPFWRKSASLNDDVI